VLLASNTPFDVAELRVQIARQPFPAGVRDRTQLFDMFGRAEPFSDSDSRESPEPHRGGWRIR
jgi:hypothetical protein